MVRVPATVDLDAVQSGRQVMDRPLTVTRRVALALPALALAACASDSSTPSDTNASPASPSALPSTANELDLIAQYNEAIAQFPQLATILTPLRDQHRAHLASLGGAEVAAPPAPSAAPVGSPQTAKARLADAEKQAAQQRLSDCLATTDEPLARTLALIAASEASHVAVLVGT